MTGLNNSNSECCVFLLIFSFVASVVEGLKKIYKKQILPLEQNYFFHDFHSPELSDPDFDARPMILLVGQVLLAYFPLLECLFCQGHLQCVLLLLLQYSTGKTTFIRYLLEKDFDGIS